MIFGKSFWLELINIDAYTKFYRNITYVWKATRFLYLHVFVFLVFLLLFFFFFFFFFVFGFGIALVNENRHMASPLARAYRHQIIKLLEYS